MKIILIRHGQTFENVKNICQGQAPGKLTKKGKQQSLHIAQNLKSIKFDIIFSSDLARAKDTTKEILKVHKKTQTIYTKELRELKKGIFEKKPAKFFDSERKKTKKELWQFKPKGGESWHEAYKRAKKFYGFLRKNYGNKTVLLVSHSTFIGILISAIMNIHFKNALSFEEHQTHECINEINVDKKGRGTLRTIHCEKHVKKLVC